jgi:hypothetical protein
MRIEKVLWWFGFHRLAIGVRLKRVCKVERLAAARITRRRLA